LSCRRVLRGSTAGKALSRQDAGSRARMLEICNGPKCAMARPEAGTPPTTRALLTSGTCLSPKALGPPPKRNRGCVSRCCFLRTSSRVLTLVIGLAGTPQLRSGRRKSRLSLNGNGRSQQESGSRGRFTGKTARRHTISAWCRGVTQDHGDDYSFRFQVPTPDRWGVREPGNHPIL